MKTIDFDVFALITPLIEPVGVEPDRPVPKQPHKNLALILANSIRSGKFYLPQVRLVGEHMTGGPSPTRWLNFDQYRVPDFALKKVIGSLSHPDQLAIQDYLWRDTWVSYDKEERRWIELDPPFSDAAERAFNRVINILEQLALLQYSSLKPLSPHTEALEEV